MLRRLIVPAILGLACASLPAAHATADDVSPVATRRTIQIPLRFDDDFIREAIAAQVYTTATGKAVLWDDGTGCGFLKLREPRVQTTNGRVRVTSRGEARVGTPFGNSCIAPVQWDGYVELFEEPVLAADQKSLQFRVVESNLYDANWRKPFIAGRLWDVIKKYAHPSFESVRIDLRAAADDLRALLPDLLRRDDLERVSRAVESLRLQSVTATDSGVAVDLVFDVEPLGGTGPVAEPTFSPEELQKFEAAWEQWDAFLTYVVKFIWGDSLLSDLRQPLADVLLDARYDILEALAPADGRPDPVPDLFVRTWERLSPVVRQIASHKAGAHAVRYFSFIAAADALRSLQAAGPDLGVDISADGLRRLVRILAPDDAGDPLVYDTAIDPQLRLLLGFGPPLPSPDLTDAPADARWDWHDWLLPRAAWAAGEMPDTGGLKRWIALPETLDSYLDAVREVLNTVTAQTLESKSLDPAYHQVYRNLVLATAWQESCWRQFIVQKGEITFLKSPVGAAGMMQVNERVWRGLYDIKGLRWDIRYNGRAGAEIVLHYLNDYAIAKKEHLHPGGVENLARATYAIYNGGPGQIARYRKANTKPFLKKIDTLFWEKYDAVSNGRAGDVVKCYSGRG